MLGGDPPWRFTSLDLDPEVLQKGPRNLLMVLITLDMDL